MSITSVSSAQSLLQPFLQKVKANGGATKSDLTDLQKALSAKDPNAASNVGSLIDAFDTADSNGDGTLSGSEAQTYATANGIDVSQGSCRPPPGEIFGGTDGFTKDQLTDLESKAAASGHDDGTISKLVSSFSESDTDGDGKISKDEFKAFADKNGIKPQHVHGGGHHHAPPPADDGSGTDDDSATDDSATDASTSTTSADTQGTSVSALQKLLQSYLVNTSSTDDATNSLLDGVSA